MEKMIELAWLLDFYGALLTERQRTLLSLHCEEDLSLAEIAEQEGISRQGVHDTLHRAEAQLYALEEKLGMLARARALTAEFTAISGHLAEVTSGDAGSEAHLRIAQQLIAALLKPEEEDNHGL